MKTLYDFETGFEAMMELAKETLSPDQFGKFIDSISMILPDYEE